MIQDDEKEGEELSSSQDAAVVQSPPVPIVPVVYDILLFGVTGFTGQLCAEYLMEKEKKTRTTTRRGGTSDHHNTSHTTHIHWATSARDPIKAEKILHTIARKVASATPSSSSSSPSSTTHPPLPLRIPPVLVADLVCADETNLRSIVQQTKVVLSCSGPFEKYSKTLVKVCAELGVYYADITGETDFVRDSITRHDRTAQKSGAVIISHCGNDCIPCDLTVFEMHRYAKRNSCELVEVCTYEDVPSSATMSGGTIATASFQLNKDRSNRSTRATSSNGNSRKDETFDPMLMSTDGTKSEYLTKNLCPKSNVSIADMNGRTAGPWIMGPVMMNCVRRSNALIGYSKDFRYGDALLQQDSYLGQFQQIGTFLLTAGYVTLPSVFQYFVPKPGEGPSREIMENGYLTLHGFGTMIDNNTNKERKLSTRFQFNKDTGYLYTAVLLVETGLLLVEKFGSLSGGCQTPASALGNDLTQRIVKEMDATFDIKEV